MLVNESKDVTKGLVRDCKARLTLLPEARPIVAEPVQSLVDQTRHQTTDPVIARFRAALKGIQATELERLYHRLPELDEPSREGSLSLAPSPPLSRTPRRCGES